MSKKFLLIALMTAFVFVFAAVAFAQDDDTAADDDTGDVFGLSGTANGDFPVTLEAGTEYEFAFDVFNTAGGDVAIKKVDITLPSTSYAIGDYDAPDAIHEDLMWEADFDEDTATITWEAFGATSSVEMGDIAEGDVLTFTFMATTDEDATDGFTWTLTGDDVETYVSGVFYFAGDDDDDDDSAADDDDDDDDDDDGGCGC